MSRKVRCPLCGETFELGEDLEQGDTTSCPGCYEELRIVTLNPPRLEEVVEYSEEEGEGEEENNYEEEY